MNKSILVVGDLALDIYYKGSIKGLSPEGPYPIVLNPKRTISLGCAGNVALNIRKLFPKIDVDIACVVGKDTEGLELVEMLDKYGIGTDLVFKQNTKTIVKSRLVGDGKSLARWDDELDDNVVNRLEIIEKISKYIDKYDCIVISDYNKGMICDKIMATIRINKSEKAKILVDPKRDLGFYHNVYLIKPNFKELKDFYGIDESKKDSCLKIVRDYSIKYLLLTLSEDGMELYNKNSMARFKHKSKSVVDVTGAGDVVLASMAGMLAMGKPILESCKLANVAACVSVGKFGTSYVTMNEIMEEMKCLDSTKK